MASPPPTSAAVGPAKPDAATEAPAAVVAATAMLWVLRGIEWKGTSPRVWLKMKMSSSRRSIWELMRGVEPILSSKMRVISRSLR